MSTKPQRFARILGTGLVLPCADPQPYELPPNLGPPCAAYACEKRPAAGAAPPGALRRLGRAQQMALAASHRALENAGLNADARAGIAICVGTGLGELGNTYAFLENVILNDEDQPKPAAFINSVHNAIAGQLAIQLGCNGENYTFLNEACSFESALWQGMHLLATARAKHVLVCGVDELNGYSIGAERGLGRVRGSNIPLAPLSARRESGTLPGEGASALVLTGPSVAGDPGALRVVTYIRTLPSRDPSNVDAQIDFMRQSVDNSGDDFRPVNFVLFNADGDASHDERYARVCTAIKQDVKHDWAFGVFKHRTGDFFAASAVGIGLGCAALGHGRDSDAIHWIEGPPVNPRACLVYNLTRTGICALTVIST